MRRINITCPACGSKAYDLKTNCESTPNTETSTSETENTLRTSDKLQRGIGYDYDDAVRKCQKLRRKKLRNADVGEEAMVLAVKRGFEQAQAKANKPSSPGQNDDKEVNRYE